MMNHSKTSSNGIHCYGMYYWLYNLLSAHFLITDFSVTLIYTIHPTSVMPPQSFVPFISTGPTYILFSQPSPSPLQLPAYLPSLCIGDYIRWAMSGTLYLHLAFLFGLSSLHISLPTIRCFLLYSQTSWVIVLSHGSTCILSFCCPVGHDALNIHIYFLLVASILV